MGLFVDKNGHLQTKEVNKDLFKFRYVKNRTFEISGYIPFPKKGREDYGFCMDMAVNAIESNYDMNILLSPYSLN